MWECGTRLEFSLTLRSVRSRFTCNNSGFLAVYCKVRKANFTRFPSNSPDKARAVFKRYLGVRFKLKKKRTIGVDNAHTKFQERLSLFFGV